MSDNILSQNTVTGFYNMTPGWSSAPWPLAQTFIAPSNMTLSSVKLWIGEIGDVLVDRLLYIYIRDVNEDGTPGMFDLTYSYVNTSTMSLPGWVEFVLDGPIELTSGISYSINAYVDGGWWEETDEDHLQYFSLGVATGNPYAAGAAYYADMFDFTFIEVSGVDLAFQLWGTAAGFTLTPTFPEDAAMGVSILTPEFIWACDGFDPDTMVFNVYLKISTESGFTLIAESITDLSFLLPGNLFYNADYVWRVDVCDPLVEEPLLVGDEWTFDTDITLTITPVFPAHEATGIKIAPSGVTWGCDDFNSDTMVFDVYFRMFGVTQFTKVGEGISPLTLAFSYNLAYNFLYFWKVNVREIATGAILLAGDEWNFNTGALTKYPEPYTRTVPDPAGGGATMTVQTAENCLKAIKHLVVASQNTLWYDYEAGT